MCGSYLFGKTELKRQRNEELPNKEGRSGKELTEPYQLVSKSKRGQQSF